MTVEACEKVITFDWNLPLVKPAAGLPGLGGLAGVPGVGLGGALGAAADTDKVSLYFFTCLSHPGVSVTVDKV